MKKPKFEIKCIKCGKPQQKNEEKSNENWNAYDANARCDCGGEYVVHINGEPLK